MLAGEQVVGRGERHQPGLEIGVEALGRMACRGAGPPRLVGERKRHGEAVLHPVVQLVDEEVVPLLRPVPGIDIGAGADPALHPAARVAQRRDPHQEPAVLAVCRPQAELVLVLRDVGGDRAPPGFSDAVEVVGMHPSAPTPAQGGAGRGARIGCTSAD